MVKNDGSAGQKSVQYTNYIVLKPGLYLVVKMIIYITQVTRTTLKNSKQRLFRVKFKSIWEYIYISWTLALEQGQCQCDKNANKNTTKNVYSKPREYNRIHVSTEFILWLFWLLSMFLKVTGFADKSHTTCAADCRPEPYPSATPTSRTRSINRGQNRG